MNGRVALTVLVILAAPLIVAGCAQPSHESNGTTPHSASPRTIPTTPSSASPRTRPTPPSATPPANALKLATDIPEESVGGSPVYFAVDNGSMPHARGAVTLSKSGVPLSYEVVAGDNEMSIAGRFGLNFEQLIQINFVRRDCEADGLADGMFIGDVVNLDPHTLLSVGSEHGRVCHNPLIHPLPKQESPSAAVVTP
jgi:hypothetical protein